MTAEVRKAEVKTHLSTIESTLTGTYQIDPASVLAPVDEPPAQNGEAPPVSVSIFETPQLREQIQKIRERLERMGAINLAAIDGIENWKNDISF